MWLQFRNGRAIKKASIPVLDLNTLRSTALELCHHQHRPVLFYGYPETEGTIRLVVVLAHDATSTLKIASTLFPPNIKEYLSFTYDSFSFHMFEREFWENFGITPLKHPWLKPVRFPPHAQHGIELHQYPFFVTSGEHIHEVGVGPVHAGIIEPGYFRFMCTGEEIHHLEIQLGYQHRSVEQLFLQPSKTRWHHHIAENIAGDSTIAHTLAYAEAIEALAQIEAPLKASAIRAIALELERAAIHIGDLAAIANDVAFLLGNAVLGGQRTLIINSLLALCGSRFGRGLIRVGGVQYDITQEIKEILLKNITSVRERVIEICNVMFSSASCLSRFENVGILPRDIAYTLGVVGLAARASGVPLDVRIDFPTGSYLHHPLYSTTLENGDVLARAFLRFIEIQQSFRFICDLLEFFPDTKSPCMVSVPDLHPDAFVVSLVEGWRGEIAHAVITNEEGKIAHYKIKDPSFHNWIALAYAMRSEGISDFPLCNKSFNLSYCGFDL